MSRFAVVVPTVGRESVRALLASLQASAAGAGVDDVEVVLVDDRAGPRPPLELPAAAPLRARVVRAGGRGPAAARNVGWRSTGTEWVVFLDDDVEVTAAWVAALVEDLDVDARVGAIQGRIEVPLPEGRRPTDWERQVAGLADAAWITADLACRRQALEAVGGFDERFRRAYREDADLALRLRDAGWALTRGRRRTAHPVPRADPWVSVRRQAGNADDPLMRRLHGRDWRARAEAPGGRRPRHLLVTAALLTATGATASGRRRLAAAAGSAWLLGTGEFAWARIAPGPRTAGEIATMIATSALIPPVATWHWIRGLVRAARLPPRPPGLRDRPRRGPRATAAAPHPPVAAVLFDRDGTLVEDVPYNGDPAEVRLLPGAREAVRALHDAGIATGVISNQSGVGRGLLTTAQVDAVNHRIDAEVGGVGPWFVCPHEPAEGCRCRKPHPGLVHRAAAELGVPAEACVVIGDIGSDVEAAMAAGARAVLVPTAVTRAEEVVAAGVVAKDLPAAVRLVLGGAV